MLAVVEAVRAARPVQVEVTNYTKDGRPFRNLMCLQPVRSGGACRYTIGLLADAKATSAKGREAIDYVLSILPRSFEVQG